MNLAEYCAPGAHYQAEMVAVDDQVRLQTYRFTPAKPTKNPPVVFVAGWISRIIGWQEVLLEMTRDFPVYYIETREKISSQVKGKAEYSTEAIGRDIVTLVSRYQLQPNDYILFGSSLGATSILDCCRFLANKPKALVLIGPNAVFRVPKLGMMVIRVFWPRLYLIIKPVIKWYLKTFRLDTKSDLSQYTKYCNALDAADPWKLKKAALRLSSYEVWDLLGDIEYPTLIVGASRDKLHEPENLKNIVKKMPRATYLDLETNARTHQAEMVEEMRKYLQRLDGKG